MIALFRLLLVFMLGSVVIGTPALADSSIAVVIGPEAPELDRFAAGELCGYLGKLFGLDVKPDTSIPASAKAVFLVGNPDSNPLVPKAAFPDLTDQGIALKSITVGNRAAMLVGGHQYPDFQPAQLPQLEYYANSGLDP